ncbi:DUF736 domain-containing protein [Nitratireductor sp. XY-223]|uniref:DUF736 domain-containing protein n=1 Tax=Nitratireductor sp. XY-223 TaxID=2561926 RepID=UPI0010AA2720|nr:DUF736 domain-containing protein [Nitratireductor sp. XY-223]
MSTRLATLTLDDNGNYVGTLTTMALRRQIRVVPNGRAGDGNQPDWRITTNSGYELGAAWKRVSGNTGNAYLSVRLAAPELGSFAIYANIVALDEVGDDDVTHLMLWSAREPAAEAA